jgi:phage terminase large subunit
MAGKAYAKKGRSIAYIAPTFQQARDIAWVQLKELCKPIAVKVNETQLEITVQTQDGGKSRIALKGWEAVETLRGQAFDFIVIDEIASMRKWEENWNTIIRPTLTDRKGSVMFVSTPKGFNHFYDLFNMANDPVKGKDYASFHFTSYDNPHIDKGEIDKAKVEISEDQFSQEYLADFRKQEGLVYKEFDRKIHLYDSLAYPRQIVSWVGGVDFGYTNPAAVAHIRKDSDNHYWVEKEFYQRQQTDAMVADYVKSQRFDYVFPDPENPAAIAELKMRGVNLREVTKGKDSVVNGVQKVRELLKQGRLHIHTSCANLIEEIESYHYPDNKRRTGNDSENPVKENDHLCFTADTKIEVPAGKILHHVSVGKKDIYLFRGSKVTSNHPYLTQRGFVRLDALRYSDRIVIWKNKLLTESPLDGTHTRRGVSLKTISFLLKRNFSAIRQNVSTGIYGKNIMEKYLKVCTSTTKIIILLITTYLISNLLHLKNITRDIMTICFQSGENKRPKLGILLSNGINLKKADLSIKGLLKIHGKIKNIMNYIAEYVMSLIRRHFQVDQNSALIIAKLEHLGQEEVFSTATSSGFFVADGIVVSNCDALRYVIMTDAPYEYQDQPEFSMYGSSFR